MHLGTGRAEKHVAVETPIQVLDHPRLPTRAGDGHVGLGIEFDGLLADGFERGEAVAVVDRLNIQVSQP